MNFYGFQEQLYTEWETTIVVATCPTHGWVDTVDEVERIEIKGERTPLTHPKARCTEN